MRDSWWGLRPRAATEGLDRTSSSCLLSMPLNIKMATKLCAVCGQILKGRRYFQESRPHHQSTEGVKQAAGEGCFVCGIITRSQGWKELLDTGGRFCATWFLSSIVGFPSDWLKLTIDAIPDELDEDGGEDEDGIGDGTQGSDFSMPKPPIWGFFLQPAQSKSDFSCGFLKEVASMRPNSVSCPRQRW